jgi:hypothetical protein
MLDKELWNQMTESQRQFVLLGIKAEQERIIELLEPLGCKANGVEHDCGNGLGYTTAQDLIKLIKGDQK